LSFVIRVFGKYLVERLPGIENGPTVNMMNISIDLFPQNSLGHFKTALPGNLAGATAQLSEILGMHKEATDKKEIRNFGLDVLHNVNAEIKRLDHFRPQTEHLVKGILSGTRNMKSELMIVEGIELVVFLIVHGSLRRVSPVSIGTIGGRIADRGMALLCMLKEWGDRD